MDRDSFLCHLCFEKDKTLNVHHRYYEKNKNPWDYDDEALITLCEECHGRVHKAQEKINRMLSRLWITDYCDVAESVGGDFSVAQAIVAAVHKKAVEQLEISVAVESSRIEAKSK